MSRDRTFLEEVLWFSQAGTPTSLDRLSVRYGFNGVKADPYRGHSLQQVHGTHIVPAGDPTSTEAPEKSEADGLYTSQANVVVGVETADCLPILLSDGQQAMALHAGWRGLTAGILAKGLELFDLRQAEHIHVVLGPAIDACHYEVGPEPVDAVSSTSMGLTDAQKGFCLHKGIGDRWHLDLASAAVLLLSNRGVLARNISVFRSCTFEKPDLWYSYRRDGADVGRNWSWITL
ncbi:MAG: polyphenol oxidase family protein [Deltaproteobacteria bacterium]|nr:polyphenol oxidase family protein [Deltaproteobacteria bacterium]